jgi:NAD-dependent dihydropyrimidine dehydrogenase PreA subunit
VEAKDIYKRLVKHLSSLGMGYPPHEALEEMLTANFSPVEVEVALAIPNRVIPLQVTGIDQIMKMVDLPEAELEYILENLSQRGLLYSGKTEDGKKGYALHQVGFGFPQTFFWKGEDTPHARNMAGLVARYFNREVTREAYGCAETKPYRYIPIGIKMEPETQAVYPYHLMETVVNQAMAIAVGHCPCRMTARLRGRGCDHPTEVCIKFDDMATYVIEKGLAREITKEEALEIIKQSEEAGLVHFVDNALKDIKHNCNCCGCACWSVGSIKRRKIPRDTLMATYFIRETDEGQCTGCGECVEACPVDAIKTEDGFPVVDGDWCIGYGVCVTKCPTEAARLRLRPDRIGQLPNANFKDLHEGILREKGLI